MSRIRVMVGLLCHTKDLDLNPSYVLCVARPFGAPRSDITKQQCRTRYRHYRTNQEEIKPIFSSLMYMKGSHQSVLHEGLCYTHTGRTDLRGFSKREVDLFRRNYSKTS